MRQIARDYVHRGRARQNGGRRLPLSPSSLRGIAAEQKGDIDRPALWRLRPDGAAAQVYKRLLAALAADLKRKHQQTGARANKFVRSILLQQDWCREVARLKGASRIWTT
jgi:hypothetical protein